MKKIILEVKITVVREETEARPIQHSNPQIKIGRQNRISVRHKGSEVSSLYSIPRPDTDQFIVPH